MPQTSQQVRASYNRLRPLEKLQVEKRSWTLDILQVVQSLSKKEFLLSDVYAQADALAKLHPQNAHVRDKIRQQRAEEVENRKWKIEKSKLEIGNGKMPAGLRGQGRNMLVPYKSRISAERRDAGLPG